MGELWKLFLLQNKILGKNYDINSDFLIKVISLFPNQQLVSPLMWLMYTCSHPYLHISSNQAGSRQRAAGDRGRLQGKREVYLVSVFSCLLLTAKKELIFLNPEREQ